MESTKQNIKDRTNCKIYFLNVIKFNLPTEIKWE